MPDNKESDHIEGAAEVLKATNASQTQDDGTLATDGVGTAAVKKNGYLITSKKEIKLPDNIAKNLAEIQVQLGGIPLWLLMQNGSKRDPMGTLSGAVWQEFYNNRNNLDKNTPIALLIESPGGNAEAAYNIAKLLINRCGEFSAIIPQYAKSAATLLSLGAQEIIIAQEAELGPLDVQITDLNKEEEYSGLDEIQSLESLFEFATRQVVETTLFWANTLEKKGQTVFPNAIGFVSDMMRPLMEKIDTVHYTTTARNLRVAEEYASRLLSNHYNEVQSVMIARKFVRNYPSHGFKIDYLEAIDEIGMKNVQLMDETLLHEANTVVDYVEKNNIQLIGKFVLK